MWLPDTDTCSYIFRRHPTRVAERFARADPDEIGLSSIVLAELYYGAARLPNEMQIRAYILEFMSGLRVYAWDSAAADHYGDIRSLLERQGTPIGSLDTMIAAHARSLEAILVTNNVRHFRRVPGLKLENWI